MTSDVPSTHGAVSSRPFDGTGAGPDTNRHHRGFWCVAGAFLVAMAFSTVPAPLYPLYQARDHFSALAVTIVFAAYAVGVATSLILAGHASDWLGRRRPLIAGLTCQLVAALLFVELPVLPGLVVARLISGLGIGLLTATATAYLHELHVIHRPGAGTRRFEIVSTAANIGGLGLGSLVAGVLAQYVDAPLTTPYLVFMVLLVASIVAVCFTPETVVPLPGKTTYRPQRISIPEPRLRLSYASALAAAFTAFAIFGVFTSLAPGFLAATLHHPSRLLAGTAAFLVFGAAALTQTLSSTLPQQLQLTLGLAAESAGLVIVAVGIVDANLAAFLLGGTLAGAGAGCLFKSAVATVLSSATAGARGEALAGLFLVAYLGLIIPVVGLGVATQWTSVTVAMCWFSALMVAMLAGTTALTLASRRTAAPTP